MRRSLKQLAHVILIVFISNFTFSQKAIKFDDDAEYIAFGGVTSLDVNQITIECWIKLDEARPGVIIAKPGAYYLRVNDDLKIDAGIYDEATDEDWHTVTGTTQLDINENFHVAFTFDGNNLKIYINGHLESSTAYTGNIDQFLTNAVYAGSQIFIDDYSDYVNANDDTKIYEHENYSYHSPGTAIQKIDVNNDRYHFTGDNDFGVPPDPDPVEDEAISIIKGFSALDYIVEVDERFSQENGIAYISKRFNDVTDKYEIALNPEPENDGICLNKVVNNVWYGLTSSWIGLVNKDQWYTIKTQITTLPSTNSIKAWFNGTLVQWYDDLNYYNSWEDPDLRNFDKLAILVHDHDYQDFTYHIYFDNLKVYIPLKGTIDELRVFNTALSQNTILSWMCKLADITHPNWSNLKGYWQFDDNTANDNSNNGNNGIINGASFVDSKVPAGYANSFGTGTGHLIGTPEVQVDITWDGDDPGSGAVFNVLQINDYPNNTTNLLSNYPQVYWDIIIDGEDASFLADVNFHYDNISGITDESALKLYTRSNSGDSWTLVSGTTTDTEDDNSDGNGFITANNLTSFSQFIISYSSTSSSQIIIDGDLSDWASVPVLGDDALGDAGSPNNPNLDIDDVYVTDDENYVYVRVKMNASGDISLEIPSLNLYISVDPQDELNTRTGLSWDWWDNGYDFNVQLHEPNCIVFVHSGVGSAATFNPTSTTCNTSIAWNTANNDVETSIPKSVLNNPNIDGFIPSNQIAVMIWVNGEIDVLTGSSAYGGCLCTLTSPLPVELSLFTAKVLNNTILLNWQTKTEVNNYGFEVEKTTPLPPPYQGGGGEAGGGWEKIGFVEGYGNSNSLKFYSFVDARPTGGSNFKYRLKQIDTDGSFEYSDEIEVQLSPSDYSLLQNYPNPFNPKTLIKYELQKKTFTTLKIYDALGREIETLVNEVKPAGIYEVELNADNYSSGVYLYQIKAGAHVETKKMLLLK